MRIGHGYDVHRFGPGDAIILGGVTIPYEQGLEAHSDGDVLIHAICDALLGAIAAGDIGTHFPDTDPAPIAVAYCGRYLRWWRLLGGNWRISIAQSLPRHRRWPAIFPP